jgi:hypothetical protein
VRILTIVGTAAASLGALLINTHAVSAQPATHQHPAGAHKLTLGAGKQTGVGDRALVGEVEGQVSYIVQNCKLNSEADAQLHVLSGQMMQGADNMRGKDPQAGREQRAEKIVTALNTYPKRFDHPDWKPLR